jgi:hypothetical protein
MKRVAVMDTRILCYSITVSCFHTSVVVDTQQLRASLTVTSRHMGGRVRPQDNSTEGERTQSFPCIIRYETGSGCKSIATEDSCEQ